MVLDMLASNMGHGYDCHDVECLGRQKPSPCPWRYLSFGEGPAGNRLAANELAWMMDQTPHEVLTQQQDGYHQSFDWSRRRFRCAGDMPNIFHSESTDGARAGPNSSDFCKKIWQVRMLLRLPTISYQAAHEEEEDLL
jgi:hypothetical protein